MTYLPTMGTIDTTHFNSTKYPGICKPTDFETLAVFKELQYQLDRLAQGMNLAKIAIDGDIGPATAKLIAKTGPWMFDTSSCASIAANADMIAPVAKGRATALNVPDKITTPATFAKPSILSASGTLIVAPPGPAMGAGASLTDAFKGMSPAVMALLGVGVVGAGYFLTRPSKGGSKPSKPSVRYRTRTKTRYIRRYRRSRR